MVPFLRGILSLSRPRAYRIPYVLIASGRLNWAPGSLPFLFLGPWELASCWMGFANFCAKFACVSIRTWARLRHPSKSLQWLCCLYFVETRRESHSKCCLPVLGIRLKVFRIVPGSSVRLSWTRLETELMLLDTSCSMMTIKTFIHSWSTSTRHHKARIHGCIFGSSHCKPTRPTFCACWFCLSFFVERSWTIFRFMAGWATYLTHWLCRSFVDRSQIIRSCS